jgi:hypothetical protein
MTTTTTRQTRAADKLIDAALTGQAATSSDIGVHAVELAHLGWAVFPLRGKTPYPRCGRCVDRTHPDQPRALHPTGECVHDPSDRVCHGMLDASSDVTTVAAWWARMYRGSNIGLRLPERLFVLDIDPRNGGLGSLTDLQAQHGQLPATLTVWSGRGDGGRHLYWHHPRGSISASRLGPGLDLKTHRGFVVTPPSKHPATGLPYRWEPAPIATPPPWLTDLLRPEAKPPPPPPQLRQSPRPYTGPAGQSIADTYTANTTWRNVLEPHGWRCTRGDGDTDGSVWLHPTANSTCSATTRYGLLFVWSTSTAFEATEGDGNVNGYTRFRAYATLNFAGDMSAAARALGAAA